MIDAKAVCDVSTVCLPVVGVAVSTSTLATVIMSIPAAVWFSWQLLDKWRAKRAEKASQAKREER